MIFFQLTAEIEYKLDIFNNNSNLKPILNLNHIVGETKNNSLEFQDGKRQKMNYSSSFIV